MSKKEKRHTIFLKYCSALNPPFVTVLCLAARCFAALEKLTVVAEAMAAAAAPNAQAAVVLRL